MQRSRKPHILEISALKSHNPRSLTMLAYLDYVSDLYTDFSILTRGVPESLNLPLLTSS